MWYDKAMKKIFIFLLLVIVIFSFFMHDIGGLRMERVKAKKGEKFGTTMIILEWNKLPQWWQKKTKNLFKKEKNENKIFE